jgi:hypothetical protein
MIHGISEEHVMTVEKAIEVMRKVQDKLQTAIYYAEGIEDTNQKSLDGLNTQCIAIEVLIKHAEGVE